MDNTSKCYQCVHPIIDVPLCLVYFELAWKKTKKKRNSSEEIKSENHVFFFQKNKIRIKLDETSSGS